MKKLKTTNLGGIDHFDSNDMLQIFKYFGISDEKWNTLEGWKKLRRVLWENEWELDYVNDRYQSNKTKTLNNALKKQKIGFDLLNINNMIKYWSHNPGDLLSYCKTSSMAQYYIFKRSKKYYSIASNKIEYNVWGGGSEFETLSDIYEHSDLLSAMKFVEKDIDTIENTETGYMGSIGPNRQKQLKEEMSSYEAEDIFEKYGVKGAGLMSPDQLKKAYYKLAVKHHPDKGGSPEVMKNINSAYDVLKNSGGNSNNTGRTDNDNWSNFDTSNDDEEELTGPRIDQLSADILEKLGRFLEPKLIKLKNSSIEFIQVSLMNLDGPILIITFSPKTNRKVEQFYIRKRDNKIKVLSLWDEYPKQFELTDRNGILEYIKNKMEQKALA